MLTINDNPPAFCSRAIGILEGMIRLDPINGERSFVLTTSDGAEIPGIVHGKAAESILENPMLLAVKTRVLAYPRTEKNKLKLIAVDVEEAGDTTSRQSDFFLIQGFNLGTRTLGMSQIGIRPNKRSKHQFEKFWITLHGHLKDEMRCVYQLKALRKGRKLFIVESDPILPKKCMPPKRNPPRKNSPQRLAVKGNATNN